MINIRHAIKRRGIAASSYGLLVGLVAVVAIAAITSSGSSIRSLFGETADSLGSVATAQTDPLQQPTATPTPTPTPSPDTDPDPFSFNNVSEGPFNQQVASGSVEITGIDSAADVSITGDGSPGFRICMGSCAGSEPVLQTGSIEAGQFLQLVLTSATSASTGRTATVTVGDYTATGWTVTTAASNPDVLTPGNTTKVVERDGVQARCSVWNGNICTMAEVNVGGGNAFLTEIPNNRNQWLRIHGGCEPGRGFCYYATGTANYDSCTSGQVDSNNQTYHQYRVNMYDSGSQGTFTFGTVTVFRWGGTNAQATDNGHRITVNCSEW